MKLNYVVRIGGDGMGDTNGCYRFVNNIFLFDSGSSAVIWIMDGIESVEFHNNVFWVGGSVMKFVKDEGAWVSGCVIVGFDNVVSSGSDVFAVMFSGTIQSGSMGFVDVGSRDVDLMLGSVFVNVGDEASASLSGYLFPSSLAFPVDLLPNHAIEVVGTAKSRSNDGSVDVGAFEYGSSVGGTIGSNSSSSSVSSSIVISSSSSISSLLGGTTMLMFLDVCFTIAFGVWSDQVFHEVGLFAVDWDVMLSVNYVYAMVGVV